MENTAVRHYEYKRNNAKIFSIAFLYFPYNILTPLKSYCLLYYRTIITPDFV